MAYKYVGKTCANCLHKQEVLSYYQDQPDDYEEFIQYANAELEVCKKCGYTTYDLETNPQNLKDVQNTKEYLRAKEFGYIPKELIEQYEYIFESYPANEYEAYAIHQKQNGNQKDYTRALFASVLNTQAMVDMLNRELTIEGDDLTEQEIIDYKKIKEILIQEIKNKCEKIIEINLQNKTKNDEIIYLLCLKITGNKQLFEKKYKEIKSKISEKLQQFISEY